MVAFGDERPESGCLYSRSAEGSRDKTRCSTLCHTQDTMYNVFVEQQQQQLNQNKSVNKTQFRTTLRLKSLFNYCFLRLEDFSVMA